nr:B3 domain-containing protein REM17-like isoform X2 [Ipomoea batatas]
MSPNSYHLTTIPISATLSYPSKLNALSSKYFTAMKTIPPKNPHFFKPIHQGFKNGVVSIYISPYACVFLHFSAVLFKGCVFFHFQNIPTAFLAKYMKGQAPKFAILRRGDRSWRVKMSGGRILGDGWEKFAAENGLSVGDVVVFRQEGDTVFDVSVFEPSLCERDCPLPHGARDTTSTSPADHPYFISTIKPYCLRKWSHLHLPLGFARSNGLMAEEKREMVLRDDKERSWPVVLGRKDHHLSLRQGWQAFRMANGLKEGDAYKFELIKTGEKPIAKLSCKYISFFFPAFTDLKAKLSMLDCSFARVCLLAQQTVSNFRDVCYVR